ncbi:hypothetical protein Ppa06_60960 [Planomonospora parontospora subsp. parontospora]|uniref:Uncharacterized protein n=2 Tax=Planomonospora parontospora TaxID=58119 RepID=A0AA37BFC2_9ACTN|nr:hypothetical protein GCM10010126_21760 [Planomonospora parontospora]GII12298.1 hypothetical protein Ppa06_60960 [Planomonospora parontospora subsp. parontospora]
MTLSRVHRTRPVSGERVRGGHRVSPRSTGGESLARRPPPIVAQELLDDRGLLDNALVKSAHPQSVLVLSELAKRAIADGSTERDRARSLTAPEVPYA